VEYRETGREEYARKAATLLRALNANLPEDVRVLRLLVTDAKFHARFSARGKEYRYQIGCGAVADPFLRAYAWHHPWPSPAVPGS